MSLTKILLILLSFLPFIPLGAQNVREIKFKTYAQHPLSDLAYPAQQTKLSASRKSLKLTPIDSHPLALLGPYGYIGGDTINFYHPSTRTLEAQVRIPLHSQEWLLIFTHNPHYPDQAGALKYCIHTLNASPAHWPQNHLIFLNLSGMPLAGKLNQKPILIQQGESTAHPVSGRTKIQLWMRDSRKNWLTGWLKKIKFRSEEQHLVLLFPPVLTGSSALDARILGTSQP